MPLYTGVGGVVKEMKELRLGVGGAVKQAKAGYVGVGGTVKQFFPTYTSADVDYIQFELEYINAEKRLYDENKSSLVTQETIFTGRQNSSYSLADQFQTAMRKSTDYSHLYIGIQRPANKVSEAYAGGSAVDELGAYGTAELIAYMYPGGYMLETHWICYVYTKDGNKYPIKDFVSGANIQTFNYEIECILKAPNRSAYRYSFNVFGNSVSAAHNSNGYININKNNLYSSDIKFYGYSVVNNLNNGDLVQNLVRIVPYEKWLTIDDLKINYQNNGGLIKCRLR
ncbi:MAG: hypothetical protein OSJ64_01040 [Firmicutes bacterium]|nr:hypothetical protein [Bacillota bacterium]